MLNKMKGNQIYKSDRAQLEIYRSMDQITVYGKGKNEILKTYNLERVCKEISYSNEQKNMYKFILALLIFFISYELIKFVFFNEPITRKEILTTLCIVFMSLVTYFTNDGFNGWLKFQDNQSEQLTISRDEFDDLTKTLINELKNGVSGEIYI